MSIGVGICAYNEEKNIGRLLDLLCADSYLKEIVVVSSGSTDRTNVIVSEHARIDPRVRLVTEPRRTGKVKAMNLLIDRLQSDVLVFISADTLPAEGSIESISRSLEDPKVGAVSARPVPINAKRGFGYVGHIMWSAHWNYLWNLTLSSKLAHVSGEMCAFSRKLLLQLPEGIINEDAYMALTMAKRAGYRIVLDPNAIVYMKAPADPVELIDQRQRVAYGHRQVIRILRHFPTVLPASWLFYPVEFLRTALAVFREFRLRVFLWGAVLLLCEIFALASSFTHAQRKFLLWKPISATKSMAVSDQDLSASSRLSLAPQDSEEKV